MTNLPANWSAQLYRNTHSQVKQHLPPRRKTSPDPLSEPSTGKSPLSGQHSTPSHEDGRTSAPTSAPLPLGAKLHHYSPGQAHSRKLCESNKSNHPALSRTPPTAGPRPSTMEHTLGQRHQTAAEQQRGHSPSIG